VVKETINYCSTCCDNSTYTESYGFQFIHSFYAGHCKRYTTTGLHWATGPESMLLDSAHRRPCL